MLWSERFNLNFKAMTLIRKHVWSTHAYLTRWNFRISIIFREKYYIPQSLQKVRRILSLDVAEIYATGAVYIPDLLWSSRSDVTAA